MDQFPRRDVERSFRKFNDVVDDLFSAKFQTWGNAFTHLITLCEEDPVMRLVTEPLRSNRRIDAGKWHAEAVASVRGMVGSGHYELPYDDDDRTALLYQFFVKTEKEGLSIDKFCMSVYGTTKYQEMVDTFNRELVLKFTREVSYRLNEILEDIGDEPTVSREAMFVFHHHDNSMTVHGNIQGSNVATGNATITNGNATYQTGEELSKAFQSLATMLHEITTDQRATVESAINVLVAAANSETHSIPEIQAAVKTVANASPVLADRLKEIGTRIGTSLLASSIFQGLKMVFGLS